jgi:hypothetical protein
MQQSNDRPIPDLPTLTSGLTLLETPDSHGRKAIQTLAIDHILLNDGPAVWVDSGHHATTSSLRQLAPSDRILDRIDVARGFTPYQHSALIRRVRDALTTTPSLLVVPAIDYHYRNEDVRGYDARDMLVRVLAELAQVARTHDIPVLLTRHTQDEFSAPVAEAAGRTIEYQSTQYGPRFEGDDMETLMYDLGDGWLQTTLAYWAQLLADRQPVYQGAAAARKWGGA